MTTIIYSRVSTSSQDTESQDHALRAWEARVGCDAEWFSETVSGAAKNRPAWEKVKARIEAGGVTRLVVFEKSRLGRDFMDRLTTLAMLRGAGVELISLTEDTDTETLEGQLFEVIRAYVSASERRAILSRQAAGIAAAKSRGVRIGGFRWRKADPAVVRRMVRGGSSMSEVGRRLGVSYETVRRIMRSVDPPTGGVVLSCDPK